MPTATNPPGRVTLTTVQELLADASLIHLAELYLEATPVNDLVAMRWSVRHGAKASSEAAQLFHFDMDRIKFLKFFFYLTDVTSKSGPHVYIKGTHRERPRPFTEDRRFSDEEASGFGERRTEITGPRGTIVAADTSGLHKGKIVEQGTRLILQIEFTNSLFGAPYERVRLGRDVHPGFRRRMDEVPGVFERFRLVRHAD